MNDITKKMDKYLQKHSLSADELNRLRAFLGIDVKQFAELLNIKIETMNEMLVDGVCSPVLYRHIMHILGIARKINFKLIKKD